MPGYLEACLHKGTREMFENQGAMPSKPEIAIANTKLRGQFNIFDQIDHIGGHHWKMSYHLLPHILSLIVNSNNHRSRNLAVQIMQRCGLGGISSFDIEFDYNKKEMFKQPSLSKMSSRSLSKIKTKIEMAFCRPKAVQHEQQKQKILAPSRSYSTKSLAKSKCEAAEKHIPFSIAVKNGLIYTDRKATYFSANSQRKSNNPTPSKIDKMVNPLNTQIITCLNTTPNQAIRGYSWFHKDGDQLVSNCKNNKGELMRYFAILKKVEGKNSKVILAALDKNRLYSGSKKYLIIKSDQTQLPNRNQANELVISDCNFLLLIDQLLLNICNINKIIVEIYQLILDGLTNLDTITKIMGRKIVELHKNSKLERRIEDIFLLILLVENDKEKYKLTQGAKRIGSTTHNE